VLVAEAAVQARRRAADQSSARCRSFEHATGEDEVFPQLVLFGSSSRSANSIPCALEEAASGQPLTGQSKRRLPAYAKGPGWQLLSVACAVQAGVGLASLGLCHVSTLHLETDGETGSGEPFSKRCRLEYEAGRERDSGGLGPCPADDVPVRGRRPRPRRCSRRSRRS